MASDVLTREFMDRKVTMIRSTDSPLDTQVGGDHYKSMAIQPAEYNYANHLEFIPGCIVKYASRYRSKGGADDLRKIIHFAQILLKLEYGEG